MNEKEISKYSVKELLDIINDLENGNRVKSAWLDNNEDRIEKLERKLKIEKDINIKLSEQLKKSTNTILKQAKEIESLNMQKEFCIQEATKKLNTPLEVKCDNTLIFNCRINGKTLDRSDLCYISEYYRACSIAEFLQENYDIEKEMSIELGYRVTDLMDDDELTEQEAIEEVLAIMKHKQLSDITVKLTELYNEMFDLCSPQELENELMCVNDMVENLKKRKGE